MVQLNRSKRDCRIFKDTTAIANTFGLDGYIIIGFDPKDKTFHRSLVSDSKLKDSSHILDLINKKVDQLFQLNTYGIEVENNSLTVIHIPPSIDKPHVIRNYQVFDKKGNYKNELQRIFVRKNRAVFPASKYDIELMFYDKKNILPEYKIETYTHFSSIEFHFELQHNEAKDLNGIGVTMKINMENLGRRPLAINKIQFSFWLSEKPTGFEIANFESLSEYKTSPIIIQTGEFYSKTIGFNSGGMFRYGSHNIRSLMADFVGAKKLLKTSLLNLHLANDNQITSPFILNLS